MGLCGKGLGVKGYGGGSDGAAFGGAWSPAGVTPPQLLLRKDLRDNSQPCCVPSTTRSLILPPSSRSYCTSF